MDALGWVLINGGSELVCVKRPLGDGIALMTLYSDGIPLWRFCGSDADAVAWSDEQRRDWVSHGWAASHSHNSSQA